MWSKDAKLPIFIIIGIGIMHYWVFTHTIREPSLLWGTDIGLIIMAPASLSLCFLAIIVQKFGPISFQSYSHLRKNGSSKVSPKVISICKGSTLLAVQRVQQESSSLQDVLEYLKKTEDFAHILQLSTQKCQNFWMAVNPKLLTFARMTFNTKYMIKRYIYSINLFCNCQVSCWKSNAQGG